MNVLGQKQINTDSKHTQNISMLKSYLCFQAIILCYTGYKNTQKIKQNNNLGLDQTSPVLLLFLSLLSTPLLPDTKAQACARHKSTSYSILCLSMLSSSATLLCWFVFIFYPRLTPTATPHPTLMP